VGEVEALVTAVERLGTGRWRDVKQRAFPLAKHRTYADLKVGRVLVNPPITSLVVPIITSLVVPIITSPIASSQNLAPQFLP
jgi:hypothetical protein